MVRDPVNRLRVDDQLPIDHKIGNILSDQFPLYSTQCRSCCV
jgi:hypothetical protein